MNPIIVWIITNLNTFIFASGLILTIGALVAVLLSGPDMTNLLFFLVGILVLIFGPKPESLK
jgi:hypothetical protein